jgi:hypothetical protein
VAEERTEVHSTVFKEDEMTEIKYLRGAFIAYEPGGYPDRKRVIPFRFNPEGLSRQLSVEQGEGGAPGSEAGAAAGGGGGGGAPAEQGADASSGTLKESFSVQIRMDFADRVEGASSLPAELGIAPEIAALEELLHPVESESQAPSDGSEPTRARPQRLTVLFVWGRKRVYPIRITGITINETSHNSQLNPVRAEVDVSAEVLGETDARDNVAVSSALEFTANNRRQMAQSFFDQTQSQGANILPL